MIAPATSKVIGDGDGDRLAVKSNNRSFDTAAQGEAI
jgi:hypothetical protein